MEELKQGDPFNIRAKHFADARLTSLDAGDPGRVWDVSDKFRSLSPEAQLEVVQLGDSVLIGLVRKAVYQLARPADVSALELTLMKELCARERGIPAEFEAELALSESAEVRAFVAMWAASTRVMSFLKKDEADVVQKAVARRENGNAARARRKSRMVETTDQWYPNYEGNKVKVSLVPLLNHDTGEAQEWRVCVWGNDDFGMEIDVATFAEADAIYDGIKAPITQSALSRLGFVRA